MSHIFSTTKAKSAIDMSRYGIGTVVLTEHDGLDRMMLEFADSRCSGGLWHCCNYVVDAQLDELIQVVHGHTPSVVANCHEFRALLVRETVAVVREWRRWVGVSAVDHFVTISHAI